MPEFKKAMRECALNLSEEETRSLFSFFDSGTFQYCHMLFLLPASCNPDMFTSPRLYRPADLSGFVDFEEFLQGLKVIIFIAKHNMFSTSVNTKRPPPPHLPAYVSPFSVTKRVQ